MRGQILKQHHRPRKPQHRQHRPALPPLEMDHHPEHGPHEPQHANAVDHPQDVLREPVGIGIAVRFQCLGPLRQLGGRLNAVDPVPERDDAQHVNDPVDEASGMFSFSGGSGYARSTMPKQ